jgi:ABC-type branched-subunit amino acid transport system substrate-binding protein
MLAIGLLAFASGAANAADVSPGIDVATKTVKIGAFSPTSGPVAFYGQITRGLEAYFKSLNDAGGIQGWKIDYTTLDDGYQPAQSMAVTRRLVENDNIFALVGAIGTTTSAAVLPYTKDLGLPVIPVGGAPDFYTTSNYFTLVPSYTWEGGGISEFLLKKNGAKKLGLLWQNDELGRAGKLGVDTYLASIGEKTAIDLSLDVKTTDFTAHIRRLSEAGVDAVVFFGSNANLASALKAAARVDYHPQWGVSFFAADPSTYKLAGDLLKGVYIGSWLLPVSDADPQIAAYRDAMAKYEAGTPLGVLSLNGWSHATLFKLAFEKMLVDGLPLTRESFMKAMESLRNVQPGGARNVSFQAGDHRGTRQMGVLMADGEGFHLVRDFEPFPSVVFDLK